MYCGSTLNFYEPSKIFGFDIYGFKKYNEFCQKYGLLPIGNIPESALRPLIKERNADIAPIIVERIKTRLKSKIEEC